MAPEHELTWEESTAIEHWADDLAETGEALRIESSGDNLIGEAIFIIGSDPLVLFKRILEDSQNDCWTEMVGDRLPAATPVT